MSKPRILIPIVLQFGVRYILRTGLLKLIQEYAHPIVMLGWEDVELQREFEEAGAEVHLLPDAKYGYRYSTVKMQKDIWFKKELRSPSTFIDEQRSKMAKPFVPRLRNDIRDIYFRAKLSLPYSLKRLKLEEEKVLWSDSNIRTFEEIIIKLKPDAIFSITPFLNSEQLLLKAAAHHKIRMITAILSFDNLTTRGCLPVIFDCYLLWNRYNEAELRRAYPEAHEKPAFIVGAPQFDFYWNSDYVWDRTMWSQSLKMPSNRPVILFGAGHWTVTPHEPQYLLHLENAIASKKIKHNPLILFRQHPNDPIGRWKPILDVAKNVVYDAPWALGKSPALTNITRSDIEKLASTLQHSQIHINVSSTMTIDGAVFNRPQIGPAYDESRKGRYFKLAQDLYKREHFLPILSSGGLEIASSTDELITLINKNFDNPEHNELSRKKMVLEIISYDDGQATHRVNDAIRHFVR